MGSNSSFKCQNCGYQATVSGGWDCGFYSETVTIHCKTCKEIVDAFLDREKDFNGDWELVGRLRENGELFKHFKCPNQKSENHDIEPWGHASNKKDGDWTCPKCGGQMTNEGVMIMWD